VTWHTPHRKEANSNGSQVFRSFFRTQTNESPSCSSVTKVVALILFQTSHSLPTITPSLWTCCSCCSCKHRPTTNTDFPRLTSSTLSLLFDDTSFIVFVTCPFGFSRTRKVQVLFTVWLRTWDHQFSDIELQEGRERVRGSEAWLWWGGRGRRKEGINGTFWKCSDVMWGSKSGYSGKSVALTICRVYIVKPD